MSEQQKTQEQLDQEAIEYAEAQSVSARFRLRHAEFKVTAGNANKMAEFWKTTGKRWTLDVLEDIYAANLDAFEKNEPYVAPVAVPDTPPEPEVPYWGALKTRRDIDAIPRAQYKEWLHDKNFEAAVNLVLRSGGQR
jgi:hypothetical protein